MKTYVSLTYLFLVRGINGLKSSGYEVVIHSHENVILAIKSKLCNTTCDNIDLEKKLDR